MIYSIFIFLSISNFGVARAEEGVIKLRFGYVTKVTCEGRLYISAVGNESLVSLQALPKELGCGVILKPTGHSGMTNLILETSSGSVLKNLRVVGF